MSYKITSTWQYGWSLSDGTTLHYTSLLLHFTGQLLKVILGQSQFKHLSKILVLPLENHICSLLAPIHTQSWSKVKSSCNQLKQCLQGSHIWLLCSLSYITSWPKVCLDEVHEKSYLVIIWPNSHTKLTKSIISSSWSRFEHCSNSLI